MPKVNIFLSALLLIVAVCISGTAYASDAQLPEVNAVNQQKRNVRGTITDDYGSVVGASISVKGTTSGTISDMDGNFSIEVADGQTLVISFIGYIPQEIVINGQTSLNIHLAEDSQALDEVVVTALGMSRDKKALGYAMTELKGEDIARLNTPNPITGLQGKVAGVQIDMGSSGPQSSSRILIRGNSSLSTNNQPIFVIDGVIIDNPVTDGTQWGSQQDFGNDIKNLNADDFESLSVLKGAAATALYGSRAANGVVLITTKKGKAGDGIGVSVSHSMTWDKVYGFPDMQDQFGPGANSAWPINPDGTINRTTSANNHFGPRYDGLPYTQGSNSNDYIYEVAKDNLKDMYQTGTYMNTNVAVQGGDEKGAFRLSYSHLQSEGTTFNNKYGRDNINLNVSRNISKFLNVEAGVTYVMSDTKNPTSQGGDRSPIYDFMYRVQRTYNTAYWLKNYKNEAGDGYNNQASYNSYLFNFLENNTTQKEDNLRGNINVNLKFTDWLTLKLMGNINHLNTLRERKVLADGQSNYSGSEYWLKRTEKKQYQLTAMLTASHRFNDFGVSGSVATEQWDTRSTYYNANTKGGLRRPGVYEISNSIQAYTSEFRQNVDRKRINSIYAFANLDWKNQLFLDITGRNDWSSALIYPDGSGNVSYFYPSVGASWIATETFRSQLPEFISFTKLRASYAIVGSDTDPYRTGIGFYKLNSDNNLYENPNDGATYPNYEYDSNELRNMNLKPEKQHSVELGLDMRFFNNRFGFDFTWYKTNTKNQILALSMPIESGVTKRWVNAGNIQNTGIEIALNATPIEMKDWRWDISMNFTRNRNKILELAEGVDKYEIDAGGMDMKAYATVGGGYGDIYTAYAYKRNDKGEILVRPDGAWDRAGEQTKVGNYQPDFLAGMFTSLTYKNITLNVQLDGRFGGHIVSGSYNYGMNRGVLEGSLYGRDESLGGLPRTYELNGQTLTSNDGMIPEGVFADGTIINGKDVGGWSYQQAYDEGLVQPISAGTYYSNKFSWGNGIREASVHKLSYLALREISISWALPRKWVNKAYIQNVNVGLICRNLGYLYNSLPDNIHPEGMSTNRSYEFYEAGGQAYTRSFGFNLNITF